MSKPIEPSWINSLPRKEAEAFFRHWNADLKARWFLLDRAEAEYNAGNFRGSACLFHAQMYLHDRLGYALDPPPSKLAIPIFIDACDQEPGGPNAV